MQGDGGFGVVRWLLSVVRGGGFGGWGFGGGGQRPAVGDRRGFGGFGVGWKVAEGVVDAFEHEFGAAEVHAVAGQAGGDFADGALDGGAVVEVGEVVGRVLDDGGDGVAAVVETDVLVVHGGGAAAVAVVFVAVGALVRF